MTIYSGFFQIDTPICSWQLQWASIHQPVPPIHIWKDPSLQMCCDTPWISHHLGHNLRHHNGCFRIFFLEFGNYTCIILHIYIYIIYILCLMYILDQWYSLRLEDIIHISTCNYIYILLYMWIYIYIITPKIRSPILFPGIHSLNIAHPHLQLQPACGEPRGDFASKLPTSLLSPPPEPDPPGEIASMFSPWPFQGSMLY